MKLFLKNIAAIIITLVILMAITLLLDIPFIQAFFVRQLLIYALMLLVMFISIRYIQELNKGQNLRQ